MPVERLVDKCLRLIRGILACARDRPHDAFLQRTARVVYERLPCVPNDLLPIVLEGLNQKQLLAIEKTVHAQGARLQTERLWQELCIRDFNVSVKSAPEATWRITYEAVRRATALKREEEWLKDELAELAFDRELKKKKSTEKPKFIRVITAPVASKRSRSECSVSSEPISWLILPPGSNAPPGSTQLLNQRFVSHNF